jgi:hypothetical protein
MWWPCAAGSWGKARLGGDAVLKVESHRKRPPLFAPGGFRPCPTHIGVADWPASQLAAHDGQRAPAMQEQDPTDYRGPGQQDCNIHQLPATASTMAAMPEVVVSGTDFARKLVFPSVNLASTCTPIEACHGDLPHKSPDPPRPYNKTHRAGQKR